MYKVLMCSDLDTVLNHEKNPEFQFFPKENIEKLESMFEVVWNKTGRPFTQEELIEIMPDIDAVFTCWQSNQFDEKILQHAPKLKILAHLAGSVTPFVSPELYDRGIQVIGANDGHFAESVAEAALTYSIVGLRRMKEIILHIDKDREEGWMYGKVLEKRGLFDRTVGLVSFGAVARHFARLLQPFHCKIKVFDIKPIAPEVLEEFGMEQVSLEELFSTCDVISLHTPWTPETENMVDRRMLSLIKKDALLVNTARGKLIDEPALIEELKTGRFSAALDVYWQEPLPSGSGLYDLPNVMLMPHIGGPTRDRLPVIASDLMEEVYDYLYNGKPLKNVIGKKRGLGMTMNPPAKK